MFKLKVIIVVLLCILSSSMVVFCMRNPLCGGQTCDFIFESYLRRYSISIPDETTKAEYRQQFNINLRKIQEFNSQSGHEYRKGINKFTHLPYREVANRSLGLVAFPPFMSGTNTTKFQGSFCNITSFDWRSQGCVSPVKDQGNCGSCFAFAANSAIESQILIKYNTNVSLSEQYAMECIFDFWKVGGDACNGGQPSYIYYLSYIKRGLATTSSVPYLGYDRMRCLSNVPLESRAGISSYRTLLSYDENEIACMLANYGPLTIAIFVNESLIQYSNGIYNDISSCMPNSMPNHAVVLVGFGIDPVTNLPYFVAKNSWGADWGEKGFFRIRKGINLCNIRYLPQQPFF